MLLPSLLTSSDEFKCHAMGLLEMLSNPAPNKMKLIQEGMLGPIITEITSPNTLLQLRALHTFAKVTSATSPAPGCDLSLGLVARQGWVPAPLPPSLPPALRPPFSRS